MARNLTRPDEYILPEELLGLRGPVTPEQFEEFCAKYDELRLELTSTGELIVMPPTLPITGLRNASLTSQLWVWSEKDATGLCFGNTAGFTLPNGAIRSPDASWIKNERWEKLTPQQLDTFSPICPDFVVELRSKSDRLSVLFNKMSEYIANGASLGWLIDPSKRRIYVYRPNEEVVLLEKPESVSGEPLLPGFTLKTATLW